MTSDLFFNVAALTDGPWAGAALALGLGAATTLALLVVARLGRQSPAPVAPLDEAPAAPADLPRFRAHPERFAAAARLAEATAPRVAAEPPPAVADDAPTQLPFASTRTAPPPHQPDPDFPMAVTPAEAAAAINRMRPRSRPAQTTGAHDLQPVLEDAVAEFGSGHRLFQRPRLADVLQAPAATADALPDDALCLDFAIVDRFGKMVAAIDFKGSSRFRETGFVRDPVKQAAISEVGVPYVEIVENFRGEDVRRAMRWVLSRKTGGVASDPAAMTAAPAYPAAMS
jgi:hypothetical protein